MELEWNRVCTSLGKKIGTDDHRNALPFHPSELTVSSCVYSIVAHETHHLGFWMQTGPRPSISMSSLAPC